MNISIDHLSMREHINHLIDTNTYYNKSLTNKPHKQIAVLANIKIQHLPQHQNIKQEQTSTDSLLPP
jgi:hypothetical protein